MDKLNWIKKVKWFWLVMNSRMDKNGNGFLDNGLNQDGLVG